MEEQTNRGLFSSAEAGGRPGVRRVAVVVLTSPEAPSVDTNLPSVESVLSAPVMTQGTDVIVLVVPGNPRATPDEVKSITDSAGSIVKTFTLPKGFPELPEYVESLRNRICGRKKLWRLLIAFFIYDKNITLVF